MNGEIYDMVARQTKDQRIRALLQELATMPLPSGQQLQQDMLDLSRHALARLAAAACACNLNAELAVRGVLRLMKRTGQGFEPCRAAIFKVLLVNAGRWDEDWAEVLAEPDAFVKLEQAYYGEGGDE